MFSQGGTKQNISNYPELHESICQGNYHTWKLRIDESDCDICLENMPALKKVSIKNITIKDGVRKNIYFQEGLDSLRTVKLAYCWLDGNLDFTSLPSLKKLVMDDFCGSFDIILNDNTLTTMILSDVYVDGTLLENQRNLVNLHIEGCDDDIDIIDSICAMTNLKTLTIMDRQIKTIPQEFSNLTNLVYLELIGCCLSDLSPLPASLKYLCINSNDITDVSMLESLRLTVLKANYVEANFSRISSITSLEILELAFCDLTDLTFIKGLTNLTSLDISYNKLVHIDSLTKLTKLVWLNVSNNMLYDISCLAECKQLKYVIAENNYLTYVTHVVDSLNDLVSMKLCGNHIDKTSSSQMIAKKSKVISKQKINADDDFIKEQTEVIMKKIKQDYTPVPISPVATDMFSEEAQVRLRALFDNNTICNNILTYSDLFGRVWPLISSSEHRDIIVQIISDDIISGCYYGKVSKLVTLMCTFFDDFSIVLPASIVITNVIADVIDNNPDMSELDRLCLIKNRLDQLVV